MSHGRLNYVYLIRELEAKDLINFLRQWEVISIDERELIYTQARRPQRNKVFHKVLHFGSLNAYKDFLQYGVLEQLKQTGESEDKLKTLETKKTIHKWEPEAYKIASSISCKIKETEDVNYELKPLKQGKVDIKLEDSTQPKTLASLECQHNPGHSGFVEVTDFRTNHLPSAYQHQEMVELIKTLAKLTVKIEVKTVKEELNSSSEIVLGSGKVDEVFFRTQKDGSCKCVCETCKTEKRERWGEIRILTSAQFAYNDSDAKDINCIFFYDDESRKEQCKYLSGNNIKFLNKEKDICMFMCVTCDIDFLKTLDTLLDTFVLNWRAAFDKYVKTVRWEETKLCVIVSHSHGCIKHVSIGNFLGNEKHMKRIRYETPTCPGSIVHLFLYLTLTFKMNW